MDRMDNKPMDNKMDSKMGSTVKNKVSDAKGMASDMVNKLADKLPENFDEQFDMVKKNAQVALNRTETLVRQYPFYSILGAAAVGAIVGSLIFSRGERVYEQ